MMEIDSGRGVDEVKHHAVRQRFAYSYDTDEV